MYRSRATSEGGRFIIGGLPDKAFAYLANYPNNGHLNNSVKIFNIILKQFYLVDDYIKKNQ